MLPLLFLAVFFLWPVVAMLARGITATPSAHTGAQSSGLSTTIDVSAFADVLRQPRTWRIVWHTLWMAGAGTLGSLFLGIPGAYVLYRCSFPGRGILRAIAVVPFVLPTVVVGVAFRALLGDGGLYEFLGLGESSWAVVLAMVFFNYAVVIRTVGTSWEHLDPRMEDAAATLGAHRMRILTTITLPRLLPSITAAGTLIFLFCSTAYGIVLTLGTPGVGTLETEIWVQTATFLDLRTAAVLSILQCVIVLAALAVSSQANAHFEKSLSVTPSSRRKLSRHDALPAVITAGVLLFVILVPLGSLLWRSLQHVGSGNSDSGTAHGLTLRNYRLLSTPGKGFAGGSDVLSALQHSAAIAVDATVIALIVGILLALVLSRTPHNRIQRVALRILDALCLLPLGISAVTLGFGFFISLAAPPADLQRFGLLVPTAQAVVVLPIVVRSLTPTLVSIDPHLREAAATLGAGPMRVLATIDMPALAQACRRATGIAFAMSLGEFGATSFLASPDFITLPVLISRLLSRPGADNYGMALAASVILGIVTSIAMGTSELIGTRRPFSKHRLPRSTPVQPVRRASLG
ncbi:MAG: iron ABC transporter permease [Actinomycetaceae bacterium]|nr:iron ABC transporter permease [Actinomycetaceae bacterium]MDY6083432.1 iron ABC transporter permease [Actinomycetaceae bacterium]